MRKSALFAAFILLFVDLSFAEVIDDLLIKADSMSYSEDGSTIEASGSVEATSKDIDLKASNILYDIGTKEISASNGFEMKLRSGFTIKGDYLDYHLRSKYGDAKNVSISRSNSVITGNTAYVDEEKVELKDATFSTCGLTPPHYHVSSWTTTLYPEDGWVIGYFGFLWVGGVPLVPVPVYVYDLSSYGLGKKSDAKNVISVPEFGNNDEDGNYVLYKVPWIASKKLNGRLVFFSTEKGGLGGGVEGNYFANESNDLNFRLSHDKRYDYYGGLTHTYYFGPTIGNEKQNLYSFFRIKEQLLFELSTTISRKERINYERVSMLPNVTLSMNDVPAFLNNLYFGGDLSYGYITEESSGAGDDRGRVNTRAYFNIPLENIGWLNAGVGYNQTWYGFTGSWTRLSQNLRLSRNIGPGLNSYVSHLHYINYTGNSPFRYERYYNLPSDEFGVGLSYNFGIHRLSVDYSYYVPDWEQKDLDYGLSIGFHCFSIDFKYRATRKEFMIGASLLAGGI